MFNSDSHATRPHVGPEAAFRNYPVLLRRMERLMEVNQNLASTLDLPKLLRKIVEAGRELTGTEATSIMLLDPSSGELRFEATTNAELAEKEGVAVPLEGSIGGWIITHSDPLLVADARADPRWHASIDQLIAFTTRSILGVPLIARDKTIGVLEAVNKRDGEFTADDVDTLQWLSAQAAVAIVNARLFEQSDLISELVHELRTPLTALMAASQLLVHPLLPEAKRKDLIATLQRETGRLSDMATSFLDMARLESGRMRFDPELFDLAALIDECIEIVRPQAAAQTIQISSAVRPELPNLESDRGMVKQVLLNLLTNAVKYNRVNGSVRASAEMSDGRIRVDIKDTGRGIPESSVPHVFERFYRVPDSDGFITGTGLGLPIARRILETLGGEIGFQTEFGRGSTFYFELPLVMKRTGPLTT